jgi:hypothetical protein
MSSRQIHTGELQLQLINRTRLADSRSGQIWPNHEITNIYGSLSIIIGEIDRILIGGFFQIRT